MELQQGRAADPLRPMQECVLPTKLVLRQSSGGPIAYAEAGTAFITSVS